MLRPEIKEWIKKYCKLHSFRIKGVDVPLEYTTKDGRVVPNRNFKYIPKSLWFDSKYFFYWDKVTKAFKYIKDRSNGQDN